MVQIVCTCVCRFWRSKSPQGTKDDNVGRLQVRSTARRGSAGRLHTLQAAAPPFTSTIIFFRAYRIYLGRTSSADPQIVINT